MANDYYPSNDQAGIVPSRSTSGPESFLPGIIIGTAAEISRVLPARADKKKPG